MKKILFLLALLPFIANAQPYPQYQGVPTQAIIYNGTLGALRGIKIPHLDSSKNYNWYSDIYLNKATGKLMYRDSVLGKDVVVADAGSILSKDSTVFTGTLSQARQLTTYPPAIITTDFGGGTWIKDDTVTVDNTGTQIITAAGQGYSRVYEILKPEYFGAKGDSVTNDSLAFANAIDFSSRTGQYISLTTGAKYDARIDAIDKSILIKGDGTLLQQMGRVALRAVTTLGTPIPITSMGNAIIGPVTGKPSPVRTETVSILNVTSPMNVFSEGDIYQASSEDYYSWSEQVLGAGRFTYKTEFIDIGGVGYDYIPTAGGVSETNVVIGATSGARGSTVSTVLNSGDTTGRLIFETVTGDFINGETITVGGVNKGTISSAGYNVVHGKMFDTYTINPVIRKLNKELKVDIQDVRFKPVGNVDSIVGTSSRQIVINLRGFAYPRIKGVVIDRSWGRGIQLSNCYRGNIEATVNNLPNMAVTSESAYGYGVELYGGCEQNTVSVQGYNVRHGFTTNPSENSNIYANINIVRVGVPKFNTVQNSSVYNSWAPGFDTHEGSYYTTFINCNVYSMFGLNKVISAAAGFQNRSLSTTYINCTANGGIAGFVDATGAYTIDKPSVTQYINCRALNYQYIGFSQRTVAADSIHSFIYENCYASADTATQNNPYYQVGYEIMGSNSKLYNCKSDNFNGIPASFVGGTYTKVVIDNFTADYTNSPSNASAMRFVTGSNNYWINNYKVIKNKNTNQPAAFFRNQSGTNGIVLNKAIVLNDTATMPLRLTIAGIMNINLTDNQFQQSGVTTKVISGAGKRLPLDADFETTPNNGTIAYTVNTADNTVRQFVRDAGTWKTLSKEDSTWMKNATQRDSTTQAFASTTNNNAFSFVTPLTTKGYDGINPSNDRGSGIRFERRASGNDFTANEIFTNTGPSDTSNLWRAYTMKSSDGTTIKVYKVDTFELRGHADLTYATKLSVATKQDTATVYSRTQSDARYEQVSRKVNILDSSSVNYPTTKAVKDFVASRQVLAKNGVRKQGDTVKLGLELLPPYTNGLITEPTYFFGGDVATEDVTGMSIDPTLKITQLTATNDGRLSNIALSNSLLITNKHEDYTTSIAFDGFHNLTISSQAPTFTGASYDIDYSPNYTDRSIPDVGWVKVYVADTNVVSSSSDVDFSTKGCYTFTGTTGIWDLMPATTQTTTTYKIANMGSGNLTINAPINTLWEAGTLMSSSVIAAGETALIWSNGTYWIIQ